MLSCKPSVRVTVITPALCRLLTVLERLARTRPVTGQPDVLVITAIADGTHAPDSRHYRGEAIDVRSHSFANRDAKRAFRADFERALGPQFRVLLEAEGTPNEHLHAQVRKDHVYEPWRD